MTGQETRVLRMVNLVSRTGRYGGPSDSAYRQADIVARRFPTTFMAGYLPDDRPEITPSGELSLFLYAVRSLVPRFAFPSAVSVLAIRSMWTAVRHSDLVHVSIARESMPVAVTALALIARVPVVLQPHGMLTSRAGRLQQVLDVVVKPLVIRAAVLVALTDEEASAIRRWLGSATPLITILHNPVITPLPSATDAPRPQEALFLGRLHQRKRLDLVAGAAAVAKRNGWADEYVVVGPDEGELALVKRSVADGAIRRYEPGIPVSAVAARVAQCAVFVLVSEREPWGNALALALALGKPVVVTESAGIRPLLEEYAAGVIVPDGDADAVAKGVHELLVNESRYDAVAAGARRLATERLSETYQLERLSALYTQVTSPATFGGRAR